MSKMNRSETVSAVKRHKTLQDVEYNFQDAVALTVFVYFNRFSNLFKNWLYTTLFVLKK